MYTSIHIYSHTYFVYSHTYVHACSRLQVYRCMYPSMSHVAHQILEHPWIISKESNNAAVLDIHIYCIHICMYVHICIFMYIYMYLSMSHVAHHVYACIYIYHMYEFVLSRTRFWSTRGSYRRRVTTQQR